ncbi:hypothetical protein FC07_GL002793 [Loigolactobacillus bifermentans DSM 20003]|jgi:thioredoxin 1|uniref:Thioredoxin domain-containing protein n=2 Tax=Loigolactobacillus bifermentans TaxID=1607 RepID=A0A0R1H5K8_9LACO|nr:hypothetical protein FC07_GL002793 [Loigolactobacillus bifermentans DSM 20003]QGG59039.1 hypothetical protein LB003_00410 [Loigolactobacillus bifermentans]
MKLKGGVVMQPLHDTTYAAATAAGDCVIEFKMDFCAPCRTMSALLTQLAPQYPKLSFYCLTVNQEPQIAQLLGVTQAPTLLFKRQGKIVGALVGPQTRTQLQQQFAHYFGDSK